jgi:hypothetical protein
MYIRLEVCFLIFLATEQFFSQEKSSTSPEMSNKQKMVLHGLRRRWEVRRLIHCLFFPQLLLLKFQGVRGLSRTPLKTISVGNREPG